MDIEGYVSVSTAAGHLGVSDRRIRQLVTSGALPAHRAGRALLIPAHAVASMRAHRSRRRRPLSAASASALIGALDEFLGESSSTLAMSDQSARSRARARVGQLMADTEPLDLLRAWIPNGDRRLELAHLGPPDHLTEDPLVAPTGISHPLSGMAPAGELEGQVTPADLDDVLARHRLVPPPTGQQGNVVLHVDAAPVSPARVVLALAHWASAREDAQALLILQSSLERHA